MPASARSLRRSRARAARCAEYRPAGKIAEAFPDVSRPAISQHLRVLREAGLVSERRQGTSRLYRLDPSGMDDLKLWFSEFWDDRLELLKQEAEIEERNSNARARNN